MTSPKYFSILKDKIKLTFKISLSKCDFYESISKPYLKNKKIFFTTVENKAWSIKYD